MATSGVGVKPGDFRRIREALGRTQEAMAETLGVHRVTIAKWESGERGIPEPVARLISRLQEDHMRDEALAKEFTDARTKLTNGKRVLALEAISYKIEGRFGVSSRHHARAIREGSDRTQEGRDRIARTLTMVIDQLVNPPAE